MRPLFFALLLLASPASAEEGFRWVVEPQFDAAGAPHQGVTPLKQGELWGLMGANGEWIAPPQYQAVGDAAQGWFPVKRADKWGLVSTKGEGVATFEFEAFGTPAPYTPAKYDGQWWYFTPSGDFGAEPLPFDTLIGNDGTCIVGTNAGVPVAINLGEEIRITSLEGITEMSPPHEGYVPFRAGDVAGHLECGFGTIVGGTASLAETRPFSEGLAAVKMGDGWGYAGIYDTAMEIGGTYRAAREFREGLAPVQDQSGLWSFIDRAGKTVIPAQFDQAYPFSDGVAGVRVGDLRGFVLPDGTFAATPQFEDFWKHDSGVAPVQKGGKWGIIAFAATDPATRFSLPLAALIEAQKGRAPGFTLQPSNPHYYVFQDVASIHSIFVSADEQVMLTTLALSDRAEIAVWDYNSHRLIRKFPVAEATQAVLLPGSEIVAAGLSTGHVVLLDAVTGEELYRIHPHQGAVIEMILSPDGKRLATSDGATVRQWDLPSGQALGVITEKAHKLRYSPDSEVLYAGTLRGGLVAMTPSGDVLNRVDEGPALEYGDGPFDHAISAMALSPTGILVNMRSVTEQRSDGYYYPRYWLEIVEQDSTRKFDLPEGVRDILTLDVSADDKMVAYSGQTDGDYVAKTEVRDLASGEIVFSQIQDGGAAAAAAGLPRFIYSLDRLGFTPSGNLVLLGMEGQDILLLNPGEKKVIASFAAPLVISQSGTAMLNGTRYFSSDGDSRVWVWDLAQGRLETSVKAGEFSFGPEEQIEPVGDKFYIYSGLDDEVMSGFDMKTLQPVPLTTEEMAQLYQTMDYDSSVPLPTEVQARLDEVAPGGVALADGRMAVVSQSVGLHRAYDLKTGALLAEFLATPDGEWLVLTPEGFFAASPKGAGLVSVSTGMRAFSVDQVYQALYRPDLVAAKLAGDPEGEVAKAAAELDLGRILGSGPAPITRFSLPAEGFKAKEPEIEIEIELQDEGGGIGRVEWRLNGVTVEVQPTRAAAALEDDVPKAKARVALDPGDNVIEVVAYNAAGLLASPPRQLVVNWDGVASTEPPALHVLAVGVNDYADGRLQLKFAAADAKAFSEAMRKAGSGLFSKVNIVTLLDADVTEAKLDAAFTAMGNEVKSQDVFLFFLAGHGKTVEGKYYFIPQDFRFEGDDPIRAHGIDQDRWQEWGARVKAKKSVMIYDTCESGSLTESRSVDAAMAQSAAVERLTRAMGKTILSASTDDAPALEGYQGHGVMTWAMLDAMGAGDSNGNATIEVTELANYLDVKVPEISSAVFGMRQVPQMSIKGSDFALGSAVSVLGDAPETFPATLTHVVAGGTEVLDGPGGAVVQTIPGGVFFGVFKAEEKDGFARIAKDGQALGWVSVQALVPLQ